MHAWSGISQRSGISLDTVRKMAEKNIKVDDDDNSNNGNNNNSNNDNKKGP
jgi:cobalamin biosynthesis protein CobT